MNYQIIGLLIIMFLYITYRLILALLNKDTPKGNRKMAWSLYGVCIIGFTTAFLLIKKQNLDNEDLN